MGADRFLTIGEFSRRVGVSVDLLRAWERRYGLPQPARAPGGRRLYTGEDELKVAAMRRAIARGMPAAAAARHALAEAGSEDAGARANGQLGEIADRLRDALDRFEETVAQEELDRLFGGYTADTALGAVVLPYLHDLGERWARDEITVGSEHFASNLVHGRLLSLARNWDAGHGPRAVLACPSGELHTIGLLAFGLALRGRGWRITYLGADTPAAALAHVAGAVRPAWIVLSSVEPDVFHRQGSEIAELAEATPVAIGGAGASPELASRCRATLLERDPVTEAAALD
jgi:DNA-binding transcriptional MerR regulator